MLTYFDDETPTARHWATSFEDEARSHTPAVWGTWAGFKDKLLSAYNTAVESLLRLLMGEHPGVCESQEIQKKMSCASGRDGDTVDDKVFSVQGDFK